VVQGTALDVARDTQGLDPRELLHATGLIGTHVAAAGQGRRQRTGHQSRIRPTEQRVRHGERAGRHVGDFREDVDRASVRQAAVEEARDRDRGVAEEVREVRFHGRLDRAGSGDNGGGSGGRGIRRVKLLAGG